MNCEGTVIVKSDGIAIDVCKATGCICTDCTRKEKGGSLL